MSEQTIEISLKPGSWVSILGDIDIDEGDGQIDGFSASPVFEGKVTQYNEETNKLVFENSDVGYAEFQEKLEQHDNVQVIRE